MNTMLAHGGHHRRLLTHELMYDGAADDEPRLAGLIDAGALDNEERKLESRGQKLVHGCPGVRARLDPVEPAQDQAQQGVADEPVVAGENAYTGAEQKPDEHHRSHARIAEDSI